MRLLCLGLLAVVLVACTTEDRSGAVSVWEVAATPSFAVGDREDGDSIVFAKVADARVLTNGLLVVSDAGAFQLVVFDQGGREVSRAGRRGRGPGEYTGTMMLGEWVGDSVAAWDAGQTRWTLMDSRSGGSRNPITPIARPVWLHAGILIHSALAEPPRWVPGLLNALSAASTEVRLAHLDGTGALWVSQDESQREWLVYIDSAAAVGSVTLPAGLTVFQFNAVGAVGLMSDTIGLEQVVVYPIARSRFASSDRTPALLPAVADSARGLLMATLRNAVMAQEMHWMKAQAYTARADSLALEVPETARFKILEATPRGWRGVAWYPETGFTCLMVIGLTIPAGFGEGEVGCGWGR